MPIIVLDGRTSANQAFTSGVAFEQGPNTITLRTVDQPVATTTPPRVDTLVFEPNMTTFMVTANGGELVEFQGSLIGNRMIIIAKNENARQLARDEMKLVLAAAITTLGRTQSVVMANLQGVVFDLR